MGGASDSWVTYGKSTARSVLFQLRAFAAFDPYALPNACGTKGVMLRFGGMTLDGDTVNCFGKGSWGQTGASCPTIAKLPANFHDIVTEENDYTFFAKVGTPSEMTLETDSAVASLSFVDGVSVTEKVGARGGCGVQPTLDFDWRCKNQGGVSDPKACVWDEPSPPSPTPSPPPSAACSLPDAQKKDCGFFGITPKTCEKKGCCWQAASTGGVPWCFYKKVVVSPPPPNQTQTDDVMLV